MMNTERRGTILVGFCAAASILLCGVVSTLGQTPGQGPAPPPIHIPHIGGSKQERPQPEVSAEGQVYIVLWFDTEDYILPQSDDAAKRIAVFLTQQGVPATFKVVGEKARVLQQRQRQDVISAIAQHEIGLSLQYPQPTPHGGRIRIQPRLGHRGGGIHSPRAAGL